MEKYLYLTNSEWANPWVNGGDVPFYKASRYKNDVRDKILTPDENVIDNSEFDRRDLRPFFNLILGPESKTQVNIEFKDKSTGKLVSRRLDVVHEDGLVVCFANRRSRYICKKLDKSCCLKIHDVGYLFDILSEKIGFRGEHGACSYTKGHLRNHFLKHVDDSWQDEYRLFWPGVEAVSVELPPGIASLEFVRY